MIHANAGIDKAWSTHEFTQTAYCGSEIIPPRWLRWWLRWFLLWLHSTYDVLVVVAVTFQVAGLLFERAVYLLIVTGVTYKTPHVLAGCICADVSGAFSLVVS